MPQWSSSQRTNVSEGNIVLRKSGSTVHAIIWMSNLKRRVARSTCMVELFAAVGTVEKLICLNRVLKKLSIDQPTGLVMYSGVTFHLCTTLSEPAEARNKKFLSTIRGSTQNIPWQPFDRSPVDRIFQTT